MSTASWNETDDEDESDRNSFLEELARSIEELEALDREYLWYGRRQEGPGCEFSEDALRLRGMESTSLAKSW